MTAPGTLTPRVESGSGLARSDTSVVREVLGFVLASERYALPLSCVREILRVPAITYVPRVAEEVLGIISVRGQVTTLIDLRRRLALPCAPPDTKSRILLVEHAGEPIGLLCDRVIEVYRLTEAEVELSSVLGAQTSSYVVGIGRPAAEPAGILILLDPVSLLKRVGHG
jgi:purine-binding chemotaxis protein CheW